MTTFAIAYNSETDDALAQTLVLAVNLVNLQEEGREAWAGSAPPWGADSSFPFPLHGFTRAHCGKTDRARTSFLCGKLKLKAKNHGRKSLGK